MVMASILPTRTPFCPATAAVYGGCGVTNWPVWWGGVVWWCGGGVVWCGGVVVYAAIAMWLCRVNCGLWS